MTDLTTFLRARLDEDLREGLADGGDHDLRSWTKPIYPWGNDWCSGVGIRESRLLAEVQAKRAILDLHTCTCPNPNCTDCDACSGQHHADPTPAPCETIKHLALPYADHPDYREEWRP